MKDTLITEFNTYLKNAKIKNVKLQNNNSELTIRVWLITYKILIDLCLIALAIYANYTIEKKIQYLIPVLGAYAVLLVILWIDFRAINNFTIDFSDKKLTLINRNFFQRLTNKYILKKGNQYSFSDITAFPIRSKENFQADMERHYIDIKLKDNSSYVVISFPYKDQAINFSRYLTLLVKSD